MSGAECAGAQRAPLHGTEAWACQFACPHLPISHREDPRKLRLPGLIGGGDVLAGVGFDGGDGGDMGGEARGVDEGPASWGAERFRCISSCGS
jgi:hypothetical protein